MERRRLVFADTTETRIRPAISLSPDIVEVGQVSQVVISITNEHPTCSRKLLPGETFTPDFDLGDGQI